MHCYKVKGGTRKRIVYGSEEFKPRWWPEYICPWVDITCNLLNIKYRGRYNVTTLLKVAVENYLMSHNLDPETYIVKEFTMEERKRRMRKRGNHANICVADPLNNSYDNTDSPLAEVNPTEENSDDYGGYEVPVQNEIYDVPVHPENSFDYNQIQLEINSAFPLHPEDIHQDEANVEDTNIQPGLSVPAGFAYEDLFASTFENFPQNQF